MGGVASILVVDDNPKFLADALQMYGYDVTVAEDGLKALKILLESDAHFDLVLLDVMMPNMDGWDTLKAIRKNKKTEFLPVIMITAVSEDQKVVSGLKIGADDYIVKPFILPNLLARVEAVLRRSKWQAESLNKSQKTLSYEKTFYKRVGLRCGSICVARCSMYTGARGEAPDSELPRSCQRRGDSRRGLHPRNRAQSGLDNLDSRGVDLLHYSRQRE